MQLEMWKYPKLRNVFPHPNCRNKVKKKKIVHRQGIKTETNLRVESSVALSIRLSPVHIHHSIPFQLSQFTLQLRLYLNKAKLAFFYTMFSHFLKLHISVFKYKPIFSPSFVVSLINIIKKKTSISLHNFVVKDNVDKIKYIF